MRHSNIIAAGPERDRALEMMEQVLAIMVAHHDDEGAIALQAIMERTMGTHADPEQDGEIWDMIVNGGAKTGHGAAQKQATFLRA